MDESVIFVQELRSRDSDICFIEPQDTISRPRLKRKCRNSFKPVPLIVIDSDNSVVEATSNENVDLNIEPTSTEIKTNQEEMKIVSLDCPVCLEPMNNLEIQITNCGHLFCKTCMILIIEKPKPKCPKCRKLVIKKSIRRVFL